MSRPPIRFAPMPDLTLWRLCQEFSIFHAALLICGHDPGDFEHMPWSDLGREAKGFIAVRTALCNAVENDTIDTVQKHWDYDNGNVASVDIYRTMISACDLDQFVKAANLDCSIFVRRQAAVKTSPGVAFRSKKLDAANRAWEAVTSDRSLLKGKSPKRALRDWLNDHAAELELVNRDGQPNQTAIEEISKVANWKPEGGAVPTPSNDPDEDYGYRGFRPAPDVGLVNGFRPAQQGPANNKGAETGPSVMFSADLDDEIPF